MRLYLQIYVEHNDRLNHIAQRMAVVRTPCLVPLRNAVLRAVSGLTFYLLLPATMLLFAWKAAVFPVWGSGLLCVAAGVVASHAMLPLRRVSWPFRALLSLSAAILAGGVILCFGALFESTGPDGKAPRPLVDLGPLHLQFTPVGGVMLLGRPFDLFRANLSGLWLAGEDLRRADLGYANLSAADLTAANLSGAWLPHADLSGANLTAANLSGAWLLHANLSGAKLIAALLQDTNLIRVKLDGQAQLDMACGEPASLPPTLIVPPLCRALLPEDFD
jgi:hypothetical protein